MKKFTKVFLPCLLTLCVLFSSSAISGASASKSDSAKENLALLRNDVSVDIYSEISANFIDGEAYSDEYAGAYIDSNGTLHLQFVNNKSDIQSHIVSAELIAQKVESNEFTKSTSAATKQLVADDLVVFENKRFAFNDLMSIKDKISTAFENESIKVELKQETNCINLYATNQEKLNTIEQYIISLPEYVEGMVKYFIDTDCVESITKSAYPGNKIYYNYGFLWLSESYGTIGFNAYYNGQWGVVTNGHVAESGKNMKCADGTLGQPTFSYIGGKVDVAFIPYPSGWTKTYSLRAPNQDVIYREATASELIEGGLVIKYGVTTGKTKNGRINSTSVDVNINYGDDVGVKTIRDCFTFSNDTQGGDSGGPVGRGKTREVFRLLGITVSTSGVGGTGIKLSNIKSAFPMTVYTQE